MTTLARFLIDSLQDKSYPNVLVCLRACGSKHYEKVYYNNMTGEVVDTLKVLKTTIHSQRERMGLLDINSISDINSWAKSNGLKPNTHVVNNLVEVEDDPYYNYLLKLTMYIKYSNVATLSTKEQKWVWGGDYNRKIKAMEKVNFIKVVKKLKGGKLIKIHPYLYSCRSSSFQEIDLAGWNVKKYLPVIDTPNTQEIEHDFTYIAPYEELLSEYDAQQESNRVVGNYSGLLINRISDKDFSLFYRGVVDWVDIEAAYEGVELPYGRVFKDSLVAKRVGRK
jgi:hypothetical protein